MAKLGSIYGGKPGRPGDMMRGIPPRPPRPPKPPEVTQLPKAQGSKKVNSSREKVTDDQDRDGQAGHTQG